MRSPKPSGWIPETTLLLFLSISSVYRNLTSTLFYLSGSQDTIISDLIALVLDLAPLHLMTRTLTVVLSSLSDSANLCLTIDLLSLLVDLYFEHTGVNILLSNSSSLFLKRYALQFALFWQIVQLAPFFLCSSILQNYLHLGDFNCHYSLRDSRGTSNPHGYLFGSSPLASVPQ